MKTLAELLNDYLDHGRSLNISRYTLRLTQFHVRGFLRWLNTQHGVSTADRLTLAHLEAWQRHLASRATRRGLPLKPATINRQIVSVRKVLHYMVQHGFVAAPLVKGLAYVKEPNLLPTSVLNHAQVRHLLGKIETTQAEGYRDRAMFELLYSSGLRAGELLGLNVADVDLAGGTAIVLGKGNKQRVVPVGRTALRVLESYLRAVRPFLVRDIEAAFFLNHAGKRMPYHTFRRILGQHIARAGLPDNVSAHTFRRSCTTELIRGGANLYHVKELLGHESLETLKHYAKLNIRDLKETHRKCHPREREEPEL
jgi:site-specific recombinase XerD